MSKKMEGCTFIKSSRYPAILTGGFARGLRQEVVHIDHDIDVGGIAIYKVLREGDGWTLLPLDEVNLYEGGGHRKPVFQGLSDVLHDLGPDQMIMLAREKPLTINPANETSLKYLGQSFYLGENPDIFTRDRLGGVSVLRHLGKDEIVWDDHLDLHHENRMPKELPILRTEDDYVQREMRKSQLMGKCYIIRATRNVQLTVSLASPAINFEEMDGQSCKKVIPAGNYKAERIYIRGVFYVHLLGVNVRMQEHYMRVWSSDCNKDETIMILDDLEPSGTSGKDGSKEQVVSC